ncbi:MAG: hypothetical protein ACRC9X_05535, partial [Bacteroidales bacterium]
DTHFQPLPYSTRLRPTNSPNTKQKNQFCGLNKSSNVKKTVFGASTKLSKVEKTKTIVLNNSLSNKKLVLH